MLCNPSRGQDKKSYIDRTWCSFFAICTFNNPIPSFSRHGSGLSWSRDSASSKSGEATMQLWQNQGVLNWNITGYQLPVASYWQLVNQRSCLQYTITQILLWIQTVSGFLQHQARTRVKSRRIKSPQTSTKDHIPHDRSLILLQGSALSTWYGGHLPRLLSFL